VVGGVSRVGVWNREVMSTVMSGVVYEGQSSLTSRRDFSTHRDVYESGDPIKQFMRPVEGKDLSNAMATRYILRGILRATRQINTVETLIDHLTKEDTVETQLFHQFAQRSNSSVSTLAPSDLPLVHNFCQLLTSRIFFSDLAFDTGIDGKELPLMINLCIGMANWPVMVWPSAATLLNRLRVVLDSYETPLTQEQNEALARFVGNHCLTDAVSSVAGFYDEKVFQLNLPANTLLDALENGNGHSSGWSREMTNLARSHIAPSVMRDLRTRQPPATRLLAIRSARKLFDLGLVGSDSTGFMQALSDALTEAPLYLSSAQYIDALHCASALIKRNFPINFSLQLKGVWSAWTSVPITDLPEILSCMYEVDSGEPSGPILPSMVNVLKQSLAPLTGASLETHVAIIRECLSNPRLASEPIIVEFVDYLHELIRTNGTPTTRKLFNVMRNILTDKKRQDLRQCDCLTPELLRHAPVQGILDAFDKLNLTEKQFRESPGLIDLITAIVLMTRSPRDIHVIKKFLCPFVHHPTREIYDLSAALQQKCLSLNMSKTTIISIMCKFPRETILASTHLEVLDADLSPKEMKNMANPIIARFPSLASCLPLSVDSNTNPVQGLDALTALSEVNFKDHYKLIDQLALKLDFKNSSHRNAAMRYILAKGPLFPRDKLVTLMEAAADGPANEDSLARAFIMRLLRSPLYALVPERAVHRYMLPNQPLADFSSGLKDSIVNLFRNDTKTKNIQPLVTTSKLFGELFIDIFIPVDSKRTFHFSVTHDAHRSFTRHAVGLRNECAIVRLMARDTALSSVPPIVQSIDIPLIQYGSQSMIHDLDSTTTTQRTDYVCAMVARLTQELLAKGTIKPQMGEDVVFPTEIPKDYFPPNHS